MVGIRCTVVVLTHALAGSDLRTVVLFGGEVTADAVVARCVAHSARGAGSSAAVWAPTVIAPGNAPVGLATR